MASPVPEAGASVESRPVDATVEKGAAPEAQSKPEVNGHSSTAESAQPQTESEKPLLNGNGHAKDHEASNGTAKEDEKMNDVVAPKETSAPAQPEESTKPTVPDAKPEESNEAREAAKEPTPPKSPKDVEMEDAKPDSEPQQEVEDKKASEAPVEASRKSEEKAPEPAPAATAAPEDTTEKSKDATPKADEKDTVSSEKTGQETAADKTTTSEGDLEPVGMSQLAIETAEGDTSTVQPSVEVSMTDAPATKTVREREDDAEEEPAAKRAKTEPKEDADVPAPVPADGGFFNFPKARFDEFEFWYDADNDAKPMTQHRVREIRKVVDRIKKTKAGGVFRDSVQKLWPGLWDKYSARIEKPMDLAELGRGLRDNKYKTLGEFKADLALILENSQQYNGPDHDITMSARTALITLWNDVKEVSEEEPTKTKQAPKPPRVRESRSAHVKPEGRASNEPAEAAPAAGSIGVALPAAKPAPAAGGADARRASTATEGDRPKRTVRAPKPKDIDYTAKPSRKKLKPELQFCDEVLQELMSPKHWGWNQWFIDAVDAEGLGIPDYYSIIKHPMDLGKISRMLGTGEIASVKDFEKNVKLMFDNCYQFNGPPEQGGVSIFAKQLQDLYTSQMKQKDSWLAKQAKANPPPASVSNASDDEEEDEEEDEAEDAPVPPDVAREIKDLEVRLREESEKLNGLFLADNPNQIMIDMQGNIVKMMQDALLKAKAKLQEHRQKNGGAKPAKKSKPAKAKAAASAGAARKATGGAAAAPKKPGNPKKKKNLTAADKDNIANAINDLEGAHLDRAIDIIKRDTGQMESEDGELELDIDQLSPEALLKLWELCKKILPGFGKDPNAAAKASPEAHRSAPAKQAAKAAASKSKKNKPMSAQEQEARIAQLREIQDLYHGGHEGDAPQTQQKALPGHDSSDDSSEEE